MKSRIPFNNLHFKAFSQRKCGPKREEVRGERRKFHNEKLHNLYSSPNIRVVQRKERYNDVLEI
jgi:hypothetical protein